MSILKYISVAVAIAAAGTLGFLAVPALGVGTAICLATMTAGAAAMGIEGVSRVNIMRRDADEVDPMAISVKGITSMLVAMSLSHMWLTLVSELTTGLVGAAAVAAAPAWATMSVAIAVSVLIIIALGWMVKTFHSSTTNTIAT